MIEFEKLIAEASKAKNEPARDIYRLILSEIQTFQGSKENHGQPVTEEKVLSIVKSYLKMCKECVMLYGMDDQHGIDAAEQVKAIEAILPKAATEEEILQTLDEYMATKGPITKQTQGLAIKYVKSKFENVDGKLVSTLVKPYIQ